jgi:hypothetical protein
MLEGHHSTVNNSLKDLLNELLVKFQNGYEINSKTRQVTTPGYSKFWLRASGYNNPEHIPLNLREKMVVDLKNVEEVVQGVYRDYAVEPEKEEKEEKGEQAEKKEEKKEQVMRETEEGKEDKEDDGKAEEGKEDDGKEEKGKGKENTKENVSKESSPPQPAPRNSRIPAKVLEMKKDRLAHFGKMNEMQMMAQILKGDDGEILTEESAGEKLVGENTDSAENTQRGVAGFLNRGKAILSQKLEEVEEEVFQ